MSYSDYPTAKQNMKKGKWIHILTKKKGTGCVNYYAQKRNNGTYCIHYMFGASLIGVPLFFLLKTVCKFLATLFNLISKGLGDEIFKDIIEEADELLKGRKHKLSTGHAYNLFKYPDTLEECKLYAEEEFNKRMKKTK